jgi:hypothetical protein
MVRLTKTPSSRIGNHRQTWSHCLNVLAMGSVAPGRIWGSRRAASARAARPPCYLGGGGRWDRIRGIGGENRYDKLTARHKMPPRPAFPDVLRAGQSASSIDTVGAPRRRARGFAGGLAVPTGGLRGPVRVGCRWGALARPLAFTRVSCCRDGTRIGCAGCASMCVRPRAERNIAPMRRYVEPNVWYNPALCRSKFARTAKKKPTRSTA